MTRFEIRTAHQPFPLMRVAHRRTRLPRRLGEPGLFYQKFPRTPPRVVRAPAERIS